MRSNVITFGKILMGTVLILVCFMAAGESGEKWQGVDETVVERIAKEHGREAKEPLINTDKGDLLLFVFLLAGTVAGFTAGYYWRTLTEKKKD
jgi:hypothetical protein